ncbi:MAG: hypothetical protein ACI87E_002451 [Mariniblastus sp.]|jgi:hypothetical protein
MMDVIHRDLERYKTSNPEIKHFRNLLASGEVWIWFAKPESRRF